MNHPMQDHLVIIQTLQAEIEQLRQQVANHKQHQRKRITFCINGAGGITVHGIGKYPISLFKHQWMRLMQYAPRLQEFITANNHLLRDMPMQIIQK